MKSLHISKEIIKDLYNKYIVFIISCILCIYILPGEYYYTIGSQLDDVWMTAINTAIHNKLVFGRDFIFTYDPLGFLSTRNVQYVPYWILFMNDLFMVSGFVYLFHHVLSRFRSYSFFYCYVCYLPVI